MTQRTRLVILAPLFNDWDCLEPLLTNLANREGLPSDTKFVIVNDGSSLDPSVHLVQRLSRLCEFWIVNLGANLGHQRAIATGLVEISKRFDPDAVIVMDSDGEDDPRDCSTLWKRHLETPEIVVVAKRTHRSEGRVFRLLYSIYRQIFLILTGKNLDFGNFSLIPRNAVLRIILMPELWNHFPATLMKSHLEIERIPLARSHRFSGKTKMSFVGLIGHGLASVSVFADRAYARLLVVASALAVAATVVTIGGVVYRLSSGQPLPGWVALGAAAGLIALFQVVTLLIVVSFITLSFRSQPSIPPTDFAARYIRSVDEHTRLD